MIDWLIIVFIQENQHHKVCFSEGPWENNCLHLYFGDLKVRYKNCLAV